MASRGKQQVAAAKKKSRQDAMRLVNGRLPNQAQLTGLNPLLDEPPPAGRFDLNKGAYFVLRFLAPLWSETTTIRRYNRGVSKFRHRNVGSHVILMVSLVTPLRYRVA